jgi:hypothetical protein
MTQTDQLPDQVRQYLPEVQRLYSLAPAQRSEQQRLLYALVVRGVEQYRAGRIGPFMLPIYCAAAFGVTIVLSLIVIGLICFLLQWAPVWIVDPLLWICTALMIYGLLAVRKPDSEGIIDVTTSGLAFGRLEDVLSQRLVASITLGTLLGTQIGLLSFSRTHLGISEEAAKKPVSLSVENFVQAIGSDVFELYGGPGYHHNVWSATAFFIFRTAYGALFAYGVYQIVMKFRARRCFSTFPERDPTYGAIIRWLRGMSSAENTWMVDHFDEYLFLRITGEQLAGNFAAVRRLTASFPRLRVGDLTRNLFVDDGGNRVFEGYLLG